MNLTMKQQIEQQPAIAWAVKSPNTSGLSGGQLALVAMVKALTGHFDRLAPKDKRAISNILTIQAEASYMEWTLETRISNDSTLPTIFPFDPDPQVPGNPDLEEVLRTLVDHFDRIDGQWQTAIAEAIALQSV
jgi:hypothetical protein